LSNFSRTPGRAITVAPVHELNLAPVVAEQVANQGMSAAQFLAIVRAYWKQMLTITIVIASIAAVTIKLLPKTYTATAILMVNSDVKDPLAGRDFPVEMISSYVSTQIELMTSPVVLLPVVDRLKLTDDREFTGGFNSSPSAVREFVQKNLGSAIQVERGIGGELLYVTAAAKNADKAANIANAIADVYMEQDRRRLNDPANERAQRYVEELAELRGKATVAQDKVTAFQQQQGIANMSSDGAGTEVQSLDTLSQRLLETQNLRRALEAKRSQQLPVADDGPGSASLQTLKDRLDTQLSQLAELSGTYGPQHPKVRELNAQIALTRQSLATETNTLNQGTHIELARTRQLEQKYKEAVAEQEAKVMKLRQSQDEGNKLVLELESAKSVYKQALDGFDQIMFQAVANHNSVSFLNRAVPPSKASKPNKVKLSLIALVGALGLGTGGPLAYGLIVARRLRCRDDMERDFGIPVLAQLKSVSSTARTT
jgi:succinoglycan biosynthesis transport protein ExoP